MVGGMGAYWRLAVLPFVLLVLFALVQQSRSSHDGSHSDPHFLYMYYFPSLQKAGGSSYIDLYLVRYDLHKRTYAVSSGFHLPWSNLEEYWPPVYDSSSQLIYVVFGTRNGTNIYSYDMTADPPALAYACAIEFPFTISSRFYFDPAVADLPFFWNTTGAYAVNPKLCTASSLVTFTPPLSTELDSFLYAFGTRHLLSLNFYEAQDPFSLTITSLTSGLSTVLDLPSLGAFEAQDGYAYGDLLLVSGGASCWAVNWNDGTVTNITDAFASCQLWAMQFVSPPTLSASSDLSSARVSYVNLSSPLMEPGALFQVDLLDFPSGHRHATFPGLPFAPGTNDSFAQFYAWGASCFVVV